MWAACHPVWQQLVLQTRLSAGPGYTPEQVQRNMARNVSGKASQEAVAPYQALPVQGPVITEHMTPALEVIEPGTASEEVGTPAGFATYALVLDSVLEAIE